MRAGRLDRRITIQRRTVTQSASGAENETWSDISYRVSAGYQPLEGTERYTADQWSSRQQVAFRVRYALAWADLRPRDRIVYPSSSTNEQSPPVDRIYDIMSVDEIGRQEGFDIKTARRIN